MRFLKIALLGSLVGIVGMMAACLTEDKFNTDFTAEVCSLTIECFDDATLEYLGWETEQDCIDAGDTGDDDDDVVCTFNADVAQDCLDEIGAVTCDDYLTGAGYDSCSDVFTDCE